MTEVWRFKASNAWVAVLLSGSVPKTSYVPVSTSAAKVAPFLAATDRQIVRESPYLVADALSGALFLCAEGTLLQQLSDALHPRAVFNLGAGLETAAEKLGTVDWEYGLGEVAEIASGEIGDCPCAALNLGKEDRM